MNKSRKAKEMNNNLYQMMLVLKKRIDDIANEVRDDQDGDDCELICELKDRFDKLFSKIMDIDDSLNA